MLELRLRKRICWLSQTKPFMPARLAYPRKSLRTTNKTACCSTGKEPRLSLPACSLSARASILDGVRLNERQYEELISTRFNRDVSGDVDVLDDARDSDDDATEQIGRCILPGRSLSNRIITAPARFYDYF